MEPLNVFVHMKLFQTHKTTVNHIPRLWGRYDTYERKETAYTGHVKKSLQNVNKHGSTHRASVINIIWTDDEEVEL